MPPTEDFVDRMFDTAYAWAHRGLHLLDESASSMLEKVERIKDKLLHDQGIEIQIHRPPPRTPSLLWNGIMDSRMVHFLRRNWKVSIGASATAIILFWKLNQVLTIPAHVPEQGSQCVLVLGNLNDPIVRSQVMDLYRRRFTVFVCSESADSFKQYEAETQFIIPIQPSSPTDLQKFTDFLKDGELASILFMPNLSYQPPGLLSVETLQYEIRSNILINYNTLIRLLPYLPDRKVQLILFNPSLTYNLQLTENTAELFISGFIDSIFHSLRNYGSLSVLMVRLGLFQVRGQSSNYKYLELQGSDISMGLHKPVYELIMSYNGNLAQRWFIYLSTFFGRFRVYYLGKYSYLSSWSFFPLFLLLREILQNLRRQINDFLPFPLFI